MSESERLTDAEIERVIADLEYAVGASTGGRLGEDLLCALRQQQAEIVALRAAVRDVMGWRGRPHWKYDDVIARAMLDEKAAS